MKTEFRFTAWPDELESELAHFRAKYYNVRTGETTDDGLVYILCGEPRCPFTPPRKPVHSRECYEIEGKLLAQAEQYLH